MRKAEMTIKQLEAELGASKLKYDNELRVLKEKRNTDATALRKEIAKKKAKARNRRIREVGDFIYKRLNSLCICDDAEECIKALDTFLDNCEIGEYVSQYLGSSYSEQVSAFKRMLKCWNSHHPVESVANEQHIYDTAQVGNDIETVSYNPHPEGEGGE